MKKILSIIIIFITFIFIYFLQSNFFSWFNIAGVKPNLFIILSLIVGVFLGKIYGTSIGIIMGLLLDILKTKKLSQVIQCPPSYIGMWEILKAPNI